jgi:hypothetical protein
VEDKVPSHATARAALSSTVMRLASTTVAMTALVACATSPNRQVPETPGALADWCSYSRPEDWTQFVEPDPDATNIRTYMRTKEQPDLLCPEIADSCSHRWFRAKPNRVAFCQEIPGCSVSAVEFQKIDGKWKWIDGGIAISCL